MTFGEKLKKWRKAKGMTQEELAVASGIKIAYMSNLERGFSTGKKAEPRPSEDLVARFAKVLEIDLDEIRVAAGWHPINKKDVIPEDIKILFHGAEGWSDRKWKAVTDAIKKDMDFIDSVMPD